jgi:small ligand-binding sensory domain FIST
MLDDLAGRLNGQKPSFGLYFNCCARGELLFGQPGNDIQMIRNRFPGVPLLGFFAYGEIAPVDHVNHLHHHSGILHFVCSQ